MEKRTKSLIIASKIIAIITLVIYIAAIVMVGICASSLIYSAITGGDTLMLTIGNVNIIDAVGDFGTTPDQVMTVCVELITFGALLFTICLIANRMFNEISKTGEVFVEEHVKTVRVIGILTAATPIVVGILHGIITAFADTGLSDSYIDSPGFGVITGVVIFCLSYFIDYGCGLKEKSHGHQEEGRRESNIQQ